MARELLTYDCPFWAWIKVPGYDGPEETEDRGQVWICLEDTQGSRVCDYTYRGRDNINLTPSGKDWALMCIAHYIKELEDKLQVPEADRVVIFGYDHPESR